MFNQKNIAMKKLLIILPVLVCIFLSNQVNAQEPVDFKGAVYGEPSRGPGDNPYLKFTDEYNIKKFAKKEDISINWKMDEKVTVKSIFILDLTSEDMDIVWKTTEWDQSKVEYDLIKDNLKVEFKSGHSYKLNILLSNRKSAAFDFMLE